MPPDMQADHLRKLVKMCKQFAKLSDLELDEIALRGEKGWREGSSQGEG